ncbi:DUF1800 domain-containing protein [Aliiglaciecola sp. CAU 1673]|uniref:DUF1800 domain-containing protein n=1 Tax=Aliiglaciecola sp. CAU 1673 TaxID=3032595 RepID=UPI0023DA05D1|nr:DUF1800 domain-containing protein [Aliiglaciecola sp. CAU 1673]MDF2176889.1 DUF1800 domain-containing protein [Aliiglaciecola sp. CAU 1673]
MASPNFYEARHLAFRTHLHVSDSLLDMLQQSSSLDSAVAGLLAAPVDQIELPDWHLQAPRRPGPEAIDAMRRELILWWFKQLANCENQLNEMMVLFWHNHFVSALSKVKWPPFMLRQNVMFRSHALGNFRTLLAEVLADPAMLIYLDNATSQSESPNENLARELMELFTLGEGNYSEQDVKEMARTLTGASVSRLTGDYVFRRRWHDAGTKSLLGQTGTFGPQDVPELILAQKACAEFIVAKLWHYFSGVQADTALTEELAATFRQADYELKPLVRAILLHPDFYNYAGNQVKSPVELGIGLLRFLPANDALNAAVARATRDMGQQLFNPPNVKGWPGGRAWYAAGFIPAREQLCLRAYRFMHSLSSPPDWQAELLAVSPVGKSEIEASSNPLLLALQDPAMQVK